MKVAIIGGSGKMGRWFADFLLKDGKEVTIIGRDENKLLKVKQELDVEVSTSMEAVKNADVILISVPIGNFEENVKQLQLYLHPEQMIMDFTSIKALPVEIMHKYIKVGKVLGTHPMFGPGAKDIVNYNVALTPTNEEESSLARKIKQYLEAHGASVTLMTPQEHDRMMTVILGLSHFIAIATADTLLNFDNLEQMKKIGGSTYKVLLTLVQSVVSEDPDFYASLQMNLPELAKTQELFLRTSKIWADIVQDGNKQEFVRRMHTLSDRLKKTDPDFNKAYKNMYKLLEDQ